MTRHALVVRLDSVGDVLVCGPAVRAVAAEVDRVTLLVGPSGAAAARLLPGVDEVLVWDCPWIAAEPSPVDADDIAATVGRLRELGADEALVLTSHHQSALPTALLLRLAGVGRIAAVSEDYPGTLLDVRIAPPPAAPEPERMLAVAVAAGYPADTAGDQLVVRPGPAAPQALPESPYVVLHPGVTAPARAYPHFRDVAALLAARGHPVVVTGSAPEKALTAQVAGDTALDLGGATSLGELGTVLAGAAVVVVANTGPAHLAAAVGTPVVSLFAPVVPALRWAPHTSRRVVLGDQDAPCADSRARHCPVEGHPCLAGVAPAEVVAAALELGGLR